MSVKKTNRATGETTGQKVLLFDVETSPNIAYIWGKYEQNALGDFIAERQIICFAWKWLGEKEVQVRALPDFKGYRKDPGNNQALVVFLHELISRADIVVAHNVDKFDDKMANTDFIVHGLKPPTPHKTVDTLKVARSRFRFNSNKLDDLGHRLGLGRKRRTRGFDLWKGCLRGDMKCWNEMSDYNKQDVVLLEKIYLKLRPWMTNHPDMNVTDKNSGCPQCRSGKLQRRGIQINPTGCYPRFQCMSCGKWSRGQYKRGSWQFK